MDYWSELGLRGCGPRSRQVPTCACRINLQLHSRPLSPIPRRHRRAVPLCNPLSAKPSRPFTTFTHFSCPPHSRVLFHVVLRNFYSLRDYSIPFCLCLRYSSFLPFFFSYKRQLGTTSSYWNFIPFLTLSFYFFFFRNFHCFYLHVRRNHNYGDLGEQKHLIHIALLCLSSSSTVFFCLSVFFLLISYPW